MESSHLRTPAQPQPPDFASGFATLSFLRISPNTTTSPISTPSSLPALQFDTKGITKTLNLPRSAPTLHQALIPAIRILPPLCRPPPLNYEALPSKAPSHPSPKSYEAHQSSTVALDGPENRPTLCTSSPTECMPPLPLLPPSSPLNMALPPESKVEAAPYSENARSGFSGVADTLPSDFPASVLDIKIPGAFSAYQSGPVASELNNATLHFESTPHDAQPPADSKEVKLPKFERVVRPPSQLFTSLSQATTPSIKRLITTLQQHEPLSAELAPLAVPAHCEPEKTTLISEFSESSATLEPSPLDASEELNRSSLSPNTETSEPCLALELSATSKAPYSMNREELFITEVWDAAKDSFKSLSSTMPVAPLLPFDGLPPLFLVSLVGSLPDMTAFWRLRSYFDSTRLDIMRYHSPSGLSALLPQSVEYAVNRWLSEKFSPKRPPNLLQMSPIIEEVDNESDRPMGAMTSTSQELTILYAQEELPVEMSDLASNESTLPLKYSITEFESAGPDTSSTSALSEESLPLLTLKGQIDVWRDFPRDSDCPLGLQYLLALLTSAHIDTEATMQSEQKAKLYHRNDMMGSEEPRVRPKKRRMNLHSIVPQPSAKRSKAPE